MNILSLFDGISCGRLAVDRAGLPLTNYFSSEIDKNAIEVSKNNFNDIIYLGDIRYLDIESLPLIDLLIGGSPCQGFSFAGKQLNFNDDRSKLFFEYVRILKILTNKNPNIRFLLENVNMKKEYSDAISLELGVQPVRINSKLFSAQMRDRLYWCNWDINLQIDDCGITLNDIIDSGFYADRDKSYCIDACYGKGSNFKRYFFRSSRQIVFEKGYYPSNIEESNANAIMHLDGNRWRILTPEECEVLQTLPKGYTEGIPKCERYKCIGNAWTVDVIAYLLKELIKKS